MDYLPMDKATSDNLPRAKTPLDHHRDMLAIAQQHLALACARSLCEPDNEKWPNVILRLVDWLRRLEDGDARPSEHSDGRLLSH